jgi:hypothetical protein
MKSVSRKFFSIAGFRFEALQFDPSVRIFVFSSPSLYHSSSFSLMFSPLISRKRNLMERVSEPPFLNIEPNTSFR